MVFNATFNNISAISWRSVLLVEETGENHRPAASHRQTLSHNVVHLALGGSRTHTRGETTMQSRTRRPLICLREIDLSFDKLHYLGTVNFKHEKN